MLIMRIRFIWVNWQNKWVKNRKFPFKRKRKKRKLKFSGYRTSQKETE
jgi:hypothetical protein